MFCRWKVRASCQMADYSTQSKVHGYPGYNVPALPWRRPSTCHREMYYNNPTSQRCNARRTTKASKSHDCCSDVIKLLVDDKASDQLTRMLTARLRSQLRVAQPLPPLTVRWRENNVSQPLDKLWKQDTVKQRYSPYRQWEKVLVQYTDMASILLSCVDNCMLVRNTWAM